MAGTNTTTRKTTTKAKVVDEPIVETYEENIVEPSFNFEAQVPVRSIANWTTGFRRLQDGVGDVNMAANAQMRLSRNEIIAQVNSNNMLFTGVDGRGSHATYYIEDSETRAWLSFDEDGRSQQVFTDDLVKDLFAMPLNRYKSELPKAIQTRAEKVAFMNAISRLNLNDYAKIIFAEKHTGYKLQGAEA